MSGRSTRADVDNDATPGPVAGAARIVARVNGVESELAPGTTVAHVVAVTCPSPRGVAVAVDREVVPRSRWDEVVIVEGTSVEIVTAAAGG